MVEILSLHIRVFLRVPVLLLIQMRCSCNWKSKFTYLIWNGRDSSLTMCFFDFSSFKMFSIALSTYVVSSTHNSLKNKQGLPVFNQIISWTTLGKHLASQTYFVIFLVLGIGLSINILLFHIFLDFLKFDNVFTKVSFFLINTLGNFLKYYAFLRLL